MTELVTGLVVALGLLVLIVAAIVQYRYSREAERQARREFDDVEQQFRGLLERVEQLGQTDDVALALALAAPEPEEQPANRSGRRRKKRKPRNRRTKR